MNSFAVCKQISPLRKQAASSYKKAGSKALRDSVRNLLSFFNAISTNVIIGMTVANVPYFTLNNGKKIPSVGIG